MLFRSYTGKHGTFTLTLKPGVWRKNPKPTVPISEVEFVHKDGDAMAMVVAERIQIPLATLRRAVVSRIQDQDKDAKVVEEEKRTVNGSPVLFLTINAKVQGIAFTYVYYLYSGKEGAIQVIAFTGQNLFKDFRPDLEEFLNGFELVKK